jgi:hypothetical protein
MKRAACGALLNADVILFGIFSFLLQYMVALHRAHALRAIQKSK